MKHLTMALALCLLIAPAALADGAPGEGPPCDLSERSDGPLAQPSFMTVAPASCSISCGSSTLSCPSGTTSCSAVNRNCTIGQRGYVVCNGSTTYCPACNQSCFSQCDAALQACVSGCLDFFCVDACVQAHDVCYGNC